MKIQFVEGKESNFILKREKGKAQEKNLTVKRKLKKVCGNRTLRKDFYTWSGLAEIKIKFN